MKERPPERVYSAETDHSSFSIILVKVFVPENPSVHSVKVLSWQFLLFDAEGIGVACAPT